MPREHVVYRSSNGDDWALEYDNGEARVLHRANASSGGALTRMPVAEFLQRSGQSPEAQAVRQALDKGDQSDLPSQA